jgi:hypothetical protein
MKIVEFFLKIGGKWFELEPEPEYLTSWSRSWSHTKMDRLCNTAINSQPVNISSCLIQLASVCAKIYCLPDENASDYNQANG